MSDRVQETREALLAEMPTAWDMNLGIRVLLAPERANALLDAHDAAVRSATLAEVRRMVDALALDWPTLFTTADGTGYVRHADIFAALDRLEGA